MPIAFSDSWARAWGDALNGSAGYRVAAAGWEGSIVAAVVDSGGATIAAVFLDVHHGECRAARAATAADLAGTDFLIEGDADAWRDLFGRRLAPLMALMTGRIRLARGELTRLLPYAGAAKELIDLAASIDSEFPPGWGAA